MIELNLEGNELRMYLRANSLKATKSYSDHYESSEWEIYWYEGTGIIRYNKNDLTHFFEFETRARKWSRESLEEAAFGIELKKLNLIPEREPEFYDEIIKTFLRKIPKKNTELGKISLGLEPLSYLVNQNLVERGFAFAYGGKIKTLFPIK